MALNLVCVLPFYGFAKGVAISDPVQAASYWATRPWNFVQVQDLAVPPVWEQQAGAPSDPTQAWQIAAANEDGNALLIGANTDNAGYLYLSTDRGKTWPALTAFGARKWYDAAISSNGLVIAATINSTEIYVSTDGGTTVNAVSPSGAEQLLFVTVSGDGTKIFASDNSQGKFYLSLNSGTSFSVVFSAGSSTTAHIAMSRDGGTQLITYNTGDVEETLLSTNNFVSSTNISPGSSAEGNTIAADANGQVIYITDNGDYIWLSVNQGGSWVKLATPDKMGIGGVSDDGSTVICNGANTSQVYLSDSFGANWVAQNPPGALLGPNTAISGDKSIAIDADGGGTVWTFVSP